MPAVNSGDDDVQEGLADKSRGGDVQERLAAESRDDDSQKELAAKSGDDNDQKSPAVDDGESGGRGVNLDNQRETAIKRGDGSSATSPKNQQKSYVPTQSEQGGTRDLPSNPTTIGTRPKKIKVSFHKTAPTIRNVISKAQKRREARLVEQQQLVRERSPPEATTEGMSDQVSVRLGNRQVQNSGVTWQSPLQCQPIQNAYFPQQQLLQRRNAVTTPHAAVGLRGNGKLHDYEPGTKCDSETIAGTISICVRPSTDQNPNDGNTTFIGKVHSQDEEQTNLFSPSGAVINPTLGNAFTIHNSSIVLQIEDDENGEDLDYDDANLILGAPEVTPLLQTFQCHVCEKMIDINHTWHVRECLQQFHCLLYTSPSPRD